MYKTFATFMTGAAIGWLIGSTIEFWRNFDKNLTFDFDEENKNG